MKILIFLQRLVHKFTGSVKFFFVSNQLSWIPKQISWTSWPSWHVSCAYCSMSWTSFNGNIDILPPRPLNQSRVKYQYFHQKRSRKWTNIPRKPVQGGGQGGTGVITGIKVNVTVALRATKYALYIVIRITLQFHQFRFPGITGNRKPFLHTFPGVPEGGKSLCRCAYNRFPAG